MEGPVVSIDTIRISGAARDRAIVTAGRKFLVRIVVVVKGYTNLLTIVRATHSPGSFTGRLNRRKQSCDENTDNRNHDE